MTSSTQPTLERSVVRVLSLLLFIGFAVEAVSALVAFTRSHTVEQIDSLVGSRSPFALLPSVSRVFIWTCIAVALFVRWKVGGDLGGLRWAAPDEPAWLQHVRHLWLALGLLCASAEALFVGYNLWTRPGITVSGAKLDSWLSLGLAVTFGLAVVLLELEQSNPSERPKPPPPASLPGAGGRLRWALASVGLLLLVVGGVWALRRPGPVPAVAATPPAAPPPPSVASPSAPAPAPEPEPSASTSPVLARFSGGWVTEEEVRERTARLPPKMRGQDSAQLRRWRLRTLVTEKLLEREAARVVALKPEWSALPEPLQRRQRLRALVEGKVPARTPPDDLPQARMTALSKLGRELYEAAQVKTDTALLEAMVMSEVGPHWQPWEVQAARASLREAERPLRFQHDGDFSSPCTGTIVPAAATYGARCECESLADNILEEDPLYFDLYLSGEGPNLLFTHNSLTPACRRIHLSSGAPAHVAQVKEAQTEFDVTLRTEVLRAPADARPEDIQNILMAMGPRFGECLNFRAPGNLIEGTLPLSWEVARGEVRGLESGGDKRKPNALSGGPVESCLRAVLESWRMVALADGPLSIDLHIKATRQHSDLGLP